MRIAPIRVRPTKLERWSHGNYLGVRDSLDPSREDERLAFLLHNVYPLQPDVGGGVVGRPGFAVLDEDLGSQVQRVYQYTKLNGTETTLLVVDGEIWTYDWGTGQATKRITTANLSGSSITLDSTGVVYCVTFADVVVFSDGTNTPFTWDGTAGGGLTKLTNAPVFYGQPVVHYSVLVGIKNAERSTIAWSEVNAPNTGYEAGGYNNAWRLGQTDQERLFALVATNDALFYFRARSIGGIWGPTSASWSSTGTHDAVSLKVGTTSPGGAVLYQDDVYFLDADGRPQRFAVGGSVQDDPGIWELCAETIKETDLTGLEGVEACYRPDLDLVQFGVRTTGSSNNRLLNFDAGSGRFVGYFDGYSFVCLGVVKNASGEATFAHGDATGAAYYHGTPTGSLWNDGLLSGSTPIQHEVGSAVFGYDPQLVSLFMRADIRLRLDAAISSLTLAQITPSGRTEAPLNWAGVALGSLWDAAAWDSAEWAAADTVEYRLVIGLNQYGRWLRLILRHYATNEQFGVIGMTVTGSRKGPNVDAA